MNQSITCNQIMLSSQAAIARRGSQGAAAEGGIGVATGIGEEG